MFEGPTFPKLGSSSVCRPLPMVFTNALELLVIMNVIASFWMGLMIRFALGFWPTLLVCIGLFWGAGASFVSLLVVSFLSWRRGFVVSAPSYCENAVVMEKQVVRVMAMKYFMVLARWLGWVERWIIFRSRCSEFVAIYKVWVELLEE